MRDRENDRRGQPEFDFDIKFPEPEPKPEVRKPQIPELASAKPVAKIQGKSQAALLHGEARELLSQLVAVYPLGYEPKLTWRKMPVSAGKAFFTRGEIGLSMVLITDSLRLQDTLVHEFAHLLAYARHGRDGVGHGEPWRQAMKDLGARPEVYHDYPVERRRQERNLVYACQKCGESFTRVRPLKRGCVYVHRGCGGSLARKK